MFIQGPYSDNVIAALQHKPAKKMALSLLDVFFSKETLAKSLCTPWQDRDLLDQNVINGIRCKLFSIKFAIQNKISCCTFADHINYQHPVDERLEAERWAKIKGSINDKCRNIRNSKKAADK